jgi:hypothetical protein
MADTAGTADDAAACGEASVLRGFLVGVVLLPQHFTAGTLVAGLRHDETTDRREPPLEGVAIFSGLRTARANTGAMTA